VPALLALPGILGLLREQSWVPAMGRATGWHAIVRAAGESGKKWALAWLLAALVVHLEFFWKDRGHWPCWLNLLQKSALALFAGGLLWAVVSWIIQSISP